MVVRNVNAVIVAGLMLWVAGGGGGDAWAASYAGMDNRYPSYGFKYFEVGIRSYRFALSDTRRRGDNGMDNANWEGNINYVGSVWGLNELQNDLPRIYVQASLNPYIGFGLAYDYLGAKTVNWGNEQKTLLSTAGDLDMHGALLYTYLRCPLMFGITPFCELGGAWYRSDFTEDTAWIAAEQGRRIQVDNPFGFMVGLGVSVEFASEWSVNLYWRQMFDVDVEARASYSSEDQGPHTGSFPMDASVIGLGAAYHF